MANTSRSINASLKLLYSEIKAEIGNEKETSLRRMVPVQLTHERLAELIGGANACWVIEDFHKVKQQYKKELSQIMKVFMDVASQHNSLKIIAIGAVNSAREVVQYDPEMRRRVAEIHVPLMEITEIEQIITKGETLLNVSFTNESRSKISIYSNGLASVCHQLCLTSCQQKNIVETQTTKFLFSNTDLNKAIKYYSEDQDDTMKALFDKALRINEKEDYHYSKEIVLGILKLRKDEFTAYELEKKIRETGKHINVTQEKLNSYLKEFCAEIRGEILRYDSGANSYSFSNPFYKVHLECLFDKERKQEEFLKVSASDIHAYINAANDFVNFEGGLLSDEDFDFDNEYPS